MKRQKKLLRVLVGGLLLISLGVLGSLFILHKLPKEQKTISPSNFNTVSDSSTGLSFNMSKKFEPIPKEELAGLNPGFAYGYRPINDTKTYCILSQTSLTASGTITPEELRDGILNEIRKLHPDVVLSNSATALNPVKFGEGKGVLLQVTYSEGTTEIKRVEVIALGKAFQVIAYCQSASADNPKYYNDFTTFFSSLKIN